MGSRNGSPIPMATVLGRNYHLRNTLPILLVQAIAGENQWSVFSEAAEITPVDTFPPAVPEGLSAVPTPQSIELAWTRNTEIDFRGYNVFRSVDNRTVREVRDVNRGSDV